MDGLHRVRVLHLSDLHARVALEWMTDKRKNLIRLQKAARERVLGSWFDEILSAIASEAAVDLVCFTGDVADWGLDAEYEEATSVLQRVLDVLGLDRSRLFVVPGNHDVNRSVGASDWRELHKLLAEREDVAAKLGLWATDVDEPADVDGALMDRVLERQRGFWSWVKAGLGRPELVPAPGTVNHPRLGYRVTLTGRWPFPIQVVGLNSAWLCGDLNEKGKLAVTREQVDWLCNENGKPLAGFRLVLMHHALADLADRDAREVEHALADERADLLLHGHQHDARLAMLIDPDQSLNIAAAGSLYEGDKGDRFFNEFHVIDAYLSSSGRPSHHDVTFYGWSSGARWHRSNALYRRTSDGKLKWSLPNAPAGQRASVAAPAAPSAPMPAATAPAGASQPTDGAAEALRRAWHPPWSMKDRRALSTARFAINPSYERDGERRWTKYSDVLVSLDDPSTSDDVYLIPSRKSPKRFHEPREIQKSANRSAKRRLIRDFVQSVGKRHLDGLAFMMTMRDGSERLHVYAKELDDFLNAHALHEERSLVYITYKGQDGMWRDRLRVMLDQDARIEEWDDSKLKAGDVYRKRMTEMVSRARVMVVLASPEYVAAPLPLELELQPAVAAANAGELTLLWVPIRKFDFAASALGPFMSPVKPDVALEDMSTSDASKALRVLYDAICGALGLQPLPADKGDTLKAFAAKYSRLGDQ
jgi:3',5'-cyclic AMP phosphodiesterase CpdA